MKFYTTKNLTVPVSEDAIEKFVKIVLRNKWVNIHIYGGFYQIHEKYFKF